MVSVPAALLFYHWERVILGHNNSPPNNALQGGYLDGGSGGRANCPAGPTAIGGGEERPWQRQDQVQGK